MELLQPKISIITVCLNAASTIDTAISSVLSQTFKDLEYIVIDGGSIDGTVELLNKYQQQKMLQYKTEPDTGVYDAMNKGLNLATGKWIYFLGSDDVFADDSILERVFSNPFYDVQIVYGNVKYLHAGVIYDGPFDLEKISQKNICHQALFIQKSVFERIGFFNVRYRMSADHEFNLRWMGLNISSVYVSETVAVYNEKGLSGQVSDQAFDTDFDQLLIENNIVCRRSFLTLKKKYLGIRYSFAFKVGNWLVRPFSLLKNKWRFLRK